MGRSANRLASTMTPGSTSPLLETLRGQTAMAPPIWLMRQAGRYLPEYRKLRQSASSFLDFCYTPDMAVAATLQPIERFGLDAAILFSDILVIPDALGADVKFVEGTGPVLSTIERLDDVRKLKPTDGIVDHLAPVYATLRELRATLPDQVALIGFSGAPWTIATYMVEGRGGTGFETVKAMTWLARETFAELMDRLEAAVVRHLIEQANAGANCVKLFDSWAGVLPDEEFDRWVVEPTARIVAAFRDIHPDVPVIGFPRQAGHNYRHYAEQTKVDALAVDQTVPLSAMQELQSLCVVQGNLDPILLVSGGEAMTGRIRRIVDAMSGGPHIFNLGHGVVPQTPPEHVADLVATVRSVGS